MPIFISCANCQTTTPLGGPVDFAQPVTCANCGAVVEDFSRHSGSVFPTLGAGASRARAPQQPSAAGHFLGVLAGGVAGLALGYYLLNLLGGPQFDWLKVPLPGVPHTERHRAAICRPQAETQSWPRQFDDAPQWATGPSTDLPFSGPEPTNIGMPSEPMPLLVDQAAPLSAMEPSPPPFSPSAEALVQPPQVVLEAAAVEPPASDFPVTGFVPEQLPTSAAQRAEPISPPPAGPTFDTVDPFDDARQEPAPPVDVFASTSQLIERQDIVRQDTAHDARGEPAKAAAGLKDAAAVPLNELTDRLKEAEAALYCRQCGGAGMVGPPNHASGAGREMPGAAPQELLPCRQCSGRRVGNVPSEAYRQLCRLAEGATVVRVDPADDAQAVRGRMQELLLAVAGGRDALNSMGRQAAYRLDQPVGSLEGVALAGTITELSREGSMHLARVVMFGTPKAVTVLSAAPIDAHVRDRVVVLGVIVTTPQTQLAGYLGPDETVVWGGFRVAWAP